MRRNNAFQSILKRKISKLNLHLVWAISAVCLYGLIILYSAAGGNLYPWVYKQMLHILLCMPFILGLAFIDIRTLYRFSWPIYFAVVVMLIIVALSGYKAMGATRWISIGSFRFQPSEPAKLAVVLMLARYFHNISEKNTHTFTHMIVPILAALLPAALVIKQPDLGTGIILLIVALSIFFAIGVRIWKFLVLGAGLVSSMPVLWYFLREYQKKRIMVFMNPEYDPKGAGYNIIQSKIAIGSGKIFGKGMASGTQNHLSFLPEYQTDFIFASMCEEFGFLGGMFLLILYGIIIYLSIAVAINARNIYGKLLVIGVTSIFFSHIFINISMVMGMMPAVGVPLPLVSYGGTMMGSMLGGFAIIMNVHINRNMDLK